MMTFPLISIHALRKESDLRAHHPRPLERISIHALRKESDPRNVELDRWHVYFNPRSP